MYCLVPTELEKLELKVSLSRKFGNSQKFDKFFHVFVPFHKIAFFVADVYRTYIIFFWDKGTLNRVCINYVKVSLSWHIYSNVITENVGKWPFPPPSPKKSSATMTNLYIPFTWCICMNCLFYPQKCMYACVNLKEVLSSFSDVVFVVFSCIKTC